MIYWVLAPPPDHLNPYSGLEGEAEKERAEEEIEEEEGGKRGRHSTDHTRLRWPAADHHLGPRQVSRPGVRSNSSPKFHDRKQSSLSQIQTDGTQRI